MYACTQSPLSKPHRRVCPTSMYTHTTLTTPHHTHVLRAGVLDEGGRALPGAGRLQGGHRRHRLGRPRIVPVGRAGAHGRVVQRPAALRGAGAGRGGWGGGEPHQVVGAPGRLHGRVRPRGEARARRGDAPAGAARVGGGTQGASLCQAGGRDDQPEGAVAGGWGWGV